MALPNPVARDYLLLLLFTGLRRTEAATLRWGDVDFVERVIRLPAARTKAGRKLDLPMTDIVRDLLVARRAIGKEEYVFPSDSKSKHISEPRAGKRWRWDFLRRTRCRRFPFRATWRFRFTECLSTQKIPRCRRILIDLQFKAVVDWIPRTR